LGGKEGWRRSVMKVINGRVRAEKKKALGNEARERKRKDMKPDLCK
jgi:hypothetical protein